MSAHDRAGNAVSEAFGSEKIEIREKGTVAQPRKKQRGGRYFPPSRYEEKRESDAEKYLAEFNYCPAVKLCGEHSRQKSSECHADVEKHNNAGGKLGRQVLVFHKKGASPAPAAPFDGTGAYKKQAHLRRSRDFECAFKGKSGFFSAFVVFISANLFPHRKGAKQKQRKSALYEKGYEIASPPAVFSADYKRHYVGADRHPHSVKAMEKAHVGGGIVKRNIIVKRHIHRSRPHSEGQRKKAHKKYTRRNRKPEQRRGGHEGAYGGDAACAEF